MIYTPPMLIQWLIAHCKNDRVLLNALNNHSHPPKVQSRPWIVTAWSRTGKEYRVKIHADVIGDPYLYGRLAKRETDEEETG